MEVILQVDKNNHDSKIIVSVPKESNYFNGLVNKIRNMLSEEKLNVRDGTDYVSISVDEIERLYTDKQNVICEIKGHQYRLKERIYELRNILSHDIFFQISQSEIVNRKFISKFKLTTSGLYQVVLTNNQITYASRRFMYKIKKEHLK